MKAYIYVTAIFSAFVLVQSAHEISPELKVQLDECLKEFELTEDIFKSPDFENPKTGCFTACVLKKGDRLMEGKLSIDKELDLAANYMPADKVDDSFKEKFTDCVNTANEEKDDCAVGGALYKCLHDKHGLWRLEE